MTTLLNVQGLTLHAGSRRLIDNLSFTVEAGQRWGILGRNGAGKTTLLHTLAGLREADQGAIEVANKPLAQWGKGELACLIGLLQQDHQDALPATVMETALLGRHPHAQGRFFDSGEDRKLAEQALATLGILDLADRQLVSLSGGERQRLALAMLLAQQPTLLLLDEPSNHLDLGFHSRLVELLRTETAFDGAGRPRSALLATHDINLAARLCDHFVLMLSDGETLAGPAKTVLTAEYLSQAYDCEIAQAQAQTGPLFYAV
jgi:iron complex transport system ATP-binding protein